MDSESDALRRQLEKALGDAYTVERELGRGGMATVFLAHDAKHDQHVAVKVFDFASSAELGPERFTREIRFAARLQHPHLLPVLDSGVSGSWRYSRPVKQEPSSCLEGSIVRVGALAVTEARALGRAEDPP